MTTTRDDWRPEEFAMVVASANLSHNELADEMRTRSAGAIEVVRNGICLYHSGKDMASILSRMMVSFLDRRRGHLECRRCGAHF